MTDAWTRVAAACGMSQQYTKNCAYLVMYGGSVDPWVDYFILAALEKMQLERGEDR